MELKCLERFFLSSNSMEIPDVDAAAVSATVDDVVAVGSGSSSSLACSGLVRVGGAGAFRAFERRLRNKSGPIPPFCFD